MLRRLKLLEKPSVIDTRNVKVARSIVRFKLTTRSNVTGTPVAPPCAFLTANVIPVWRRATVTVPSVIVTGAGTLTAAEIKVTVALTRESTVNVLASMRIFSIRIVLRRTTDVQRSRLAATGVPGTGVPKPSPGAEMMGGMRTASIPFATIRLVITVDAGESVTSIVPVGGGNVSMTGGGQLRRISPISSLIPSARIG